MKKKILILTVIAALLLSSATLIWALANPSADSGAGRQSDPLISVSYIEDVLMPRISTYINQRLAGFDGGANVPSPGFNPHFEVVEVRAGQRLMGYAGTEFILRSGAATIIASELGGISDTTSGIDLPHTMQAPHNHLLIIPRSDGRGLNITIDALVMVRGRYRVQ